MTHHGFLATLVTLAVLPAWCETASSAQPEADEAPVRRWTSSTGSSIDAKFLDLVDGEVWLEVTVRRRAFPGETLGGVNWAGENYAAALDA